MSDLRERLQRSLGNAFCLERELGGGGMSHVFLAVETALGRTVVIKVVAPELAQGLSTARFAREVRVAARLQQANIVPVLAAGDAGGLPYYTMPFVEGHSLRERLARGSLSTLEAVGILRDVARALAFAHAHGVIHRDIKPENILLSGGVAMVTDFGIAKAIGESRNQEVSALEGPVGSLTQLGYAVGTPAYMAPEQAVGGTVDQRADLYSWGILAWELLAGTHPFRHCSTVPQLIVAHVAECPGSLLQRNPEVPPEVAALVMQCLEKDPAARPADADSLVAVLLRPAAGSRRPGGGPLLARRRVMVTLPVLAVLMAGGAMLYVRSSAPRPGNPTVVVIPFENLGAPTDGYFADGMSEEVASQLARIPGIRVLARQSVQRFRGSGKSPREVALALGAEYALSGSVRWARGATEGVGTRPQVRVVSALLRATSGEQVWGDAYQEPLTDIFHVQSEIAERVALALSITLGGAERAALRRPESRDPEARDAQLLARALLHQRGLPNLRRAITEFERAIARDPTYARAWAGLAEATAYLPDYWDTPGTTTENRRRSEAAARRAVALDSLLPEAHSALSNALYHEYRFNEALAEIDRALALDPSAAMAYKDKGDILLALGRVAEAETPFRQAIAFDPLIPVSHVGLALWQVAVGRADSAVGAVRRAVALDTSNTYWRFPEAWILVQVGRIPEAITACGLATGDSTGCRRLWTGLTDPGRRSIGRALLDVAPTSPTTPRQLTPMLQAVGYTMIGLPDSAFARLAVGVALRDPTWSAVVNSPLLTPLRNDPRWQRIVEEVQRR